MALKIRKVPDAIVFALVAVYNLFKRELCSSISSYPHCDITSTTSGDYTAPTSSALLPSSASATTLPTTITRAENIRTVLLVHFLDAIAHVAADAVAYAAITTTTVPLATDQATVNAALNAMKAAWNTNLASTATHFTADSTYTVATADATDLASSEALANALYTAVRGHIQFGFTTPSIQLVSA
jgi:hypothetical protein